jgi:regulator of chromosome condensation
VYTPASAGSRVSAVASGTDHILALTAGGEVYSWGCGEKGRLGRLPEADADNTSKRDEAGGGVGYRGQALNRR